MKFEHTQVSNMKNAFRGLRNPLNSWSKSDSEFGISNTDETSAFEVATLWCANDKLHIIDSKYDQIWSKYTNWLIENGILQQNGDFIEYAFIGPKDMDLAHRMIKAGSSDRKFLRQIFVSVDVTAPLYWLKEADTYKVGTVTNSTSTMHKLASTPITLDRFEINDYNNNLEIRSLDADDGIYTDFVEDFVENEGIIYFLETLRQKYNETKDKKYWKELIRWLPEGWLQTRTFTCNYEVLRNIYSQRKFHKLTEWHQFCNWIENLPYADDLILFDINKKL